jgi:integrase
VVPGASASAGTSSRTFRFQRYWDVLPKVCAPSYRAPTAGKDERGVGYVKRSAIAGHTFDSVAAGSPPRLVARNGRSPRNVADRRLHGTTGEMPIERLQADLRRSVGSWLAMSGHSLLDIEKGLAHSSPRTTQTYARLTDDAFGMTV